MFGRKIFAEQNKELGLRLKWSTPVEMLKQATSVAADLLLVDGNPLEDIRLLEDPETNLKLIMKDGVIYKNTLN